MENRLMLNIFGAIANILGNMNIAFADSVIGGYSLEEVTNRTVKSVVNKGYADIEICDESAAFIDEFRVWANSDVVTRVRFLININKDGDKEFAYYSIKEGLIPVKE